jgi:hypothetical protein
MFKLVLTLVLLGFVLYYPTTTALADCDHSSCGGCGSCDDGTDCTDFICCDYFCGQALDMASVCCGLFEDQCPDQDCPGSGLDPSSPECWHYCQNQYNECISAQVDSYIQCEHDCKAGAPACCL